MAFSPALADQTQTLACRAPDVAIRRVTAERGLHPAWVDECPFEDDVETYTAGGIRQWACPLCGTEHADEVE